MASTIVLPLALLLVTNKLKAQAPDSLLRTDLNAARIGNNTFAYRNYVMGILKPANNQRLNFNLGTDHIYNTAQRLNPFVSRDVLFDVNHYIRLKNGCAFGQSAFVNDYGATRTRLAAYMPYLQLGRNIGDRFAFFSQARAGLVSDKRINYTNTGIGYEGLASWVMQGSDTTVASGFAARFGQNNISPRRSNYGGVMASLDKVYDKAASISTGASFQSRLVEDYLAGSDSSYNIQSIRSDTLNLFMNIHYKLSKWMYLRSGNQYARPNRYFNYRPYVGANNRVNIQYTQDELNLREEIGLEMPRLESSLRLEYYLRDRVYGLGRNPGLTQSVIDSLLRNQGFPEVSVQDITESNTAWYYNIKYKPGRHTFSLNTVSQLLRVDTRSKLNTQDRDELLYTGEMAWATFWNTAFRTNLKLSGSWRHFVYLDAEQSVENFKERILRLEPSFRWSQGPISWNGNYNLFVTYNVRDFETEQDRNRSNRILQTTHNVQVRLSRKYAILTDFIRRENRLGQLNWETFKESPIDTVVVYDVNMRLQRSLQIKGAALRLQLGYRIYRQSRRNTAGLRLASGPRLVYLDNITLQHGPKVICNYDLGTRLHFQADVWLQLARIYNTWRESDNIYLGQTFSPDQLALVQRNFFPYFTVGLIWNLEGKVK